MTGRRAMGGWDQRLSRALQFKPGHVGGRVASAQPIQRRGGTLRRPSIGSAYAPPTVPPTFVERNERKPTGTTFDINDEFYSPDPVTDYVYCWAFQTNGGVTPPSGWNTLASGVAGGDVGYWVGWAKTSEISDWTLTFDRAGYGSDGYNVHVVSHWWNGGNMTPTILTPSVVGAVSTLASPAIPSEYTYGHQVQFITYRDTTYTSGPASFTFSGSASYDKTRDWYYYHTDTPYSGTWSFFSDSGRATAKDIVSAVSFVVGWT